MIKEFYEGKDIFITGGSGILGKAIIEKLLRTCNVRTIFILLRSKRNFTAEQRLERLKKDKTFFLIHEKNPEDLNKIVAIPGDVCLPQLGVSPESAKLTEHVSVVLHCAATVRFDELLLDAIRLNVGGTYEAIQFAKTLKHLKLFMHVSTFFSNPYLKKVENKIYKSPLDWRLCLRLLKHDLKGDTLDALTKLMTEGFPNTYTFTKNIAENLVNDHRNELPVAVTRPSIVIFSLDEPLPGFPSGAVGASGLFALVAAGVLKSVHIGHKTRFDITFLDIGVKTILVYIVDAVQYYEANKGKSLEKIHVTMTSSANYLPQTFKFLCQATDVYKVWEKFPILKSFQAPSCTYTSCRYHYLLLLFTQQILPAICMDLALKACGQKPGVMSVVRKAYQSLEVMKPFLFNTWDSEGIAPDNPMIGVEAEFSISKHMESLPLPGSEVMMVFNMISQLPRFVFDEDEKATEKARTLLKIKKCIYNGVRWTFTFYAFRWLYTHCELLH